MAKRAEEEWEEDPGQEDDLRKGDKERKKGEKEKRESFFFFL